MPLSVARLAGNGLFRFIYPFLGVVAVDVGLGEGAEGLLITGLAVGGMVLPLVSSTLVGDEDAPRRSTAAGIVAMFVGAVVLALVAPAAAGVGRWVGVTVAIAAMVLLGLAKPLLDVGAMTYVSARVGWHERGRALSIMELTWAGGLLVLAPVGLLAERVGWQPTLVLLGVVSLATVPLLRRWLDPDAVTAGLVRDVPGSSDEVATAASAARPDRPTPAARPPRRSTVLFLIAFGLIFVALESTFGVVGLWLGDVRGISPGRIAGLTAIGGIGELGGSLFTVAVVDRVGKARTAGIGLLTCAVGFGLLGSAGPLWLALVGLAIGLFGTETAIVAGIPLASEIAPTRRAAFLAHAVAWSSVARAVMGGVAALVLRRGGIGLNTSISVVAALVAVGVLVALVRGDPRLRG